jgi:2-polyprenyl-3-methyl-5-hydroxy-6-metoxy-1,4-benzoquinol methylase
MNTNWSCPICKAEQQKNVIANIVWRKEIPGPSKYNVIKCTNCTIEVSDPIPPTEVLNEYYANYEPTRTDNNKYRSKELIDLNTPVIDYLLGYLGKSHDEIKFLDYGFGAGAFVIKLASRGLSVGAIDYSEQNINQLKNYCIDNNLKIDTYNITKTGWNDLGKIQFDCITLFQVIEHLQDPVNTLTKLNELQGRNGLLYIECPNQDGLFFNIKNKIRPIINRKFMWGSLSPPQHLFGFNRKSLQKALEVSGYQTIEICDYRVAGSVHAPETTYWYPSIKEWLINKNKRTPYGTAKMLIRLADYPASKILKSGGGLFALARKL